MKLSTANILIFLAVPVTSAPIENDKRQFESLSLPSITLPSTGGLSLPTDTASLSLPSITLLSTGGLSLPTGTTGLGSVEGSSSGLGSSTGSSNGSSGGLSGLGSLSSGAGTEWTRSTTLKKRQSLDGLGAWSTGIPSSGSGSLGSGSTGGLGSGSSIAGLKERHQLELDSLVLDRSGSASKSSATSRVSADGSCKSVTLLFARGTGETGTVETIIGPPLADALASQLSADKFGSEGVDYPADAAGNVGLGCSGGPERASQAGSILSSCPDTQLVLGGQSQGAMDVHNAVGSQGLDGSKVAAAVLFGDPFNGQPLDGIDASKVKEFCGGTDTLCSGGGDTTGSGSHLSYGSGAEAAAQFIVSAIVA